MDYQDPPTSPNKAETNDPKIVLSKETLQLLNSEHKKYASQRKITGLHNYISLPPQKIGVSLQSNLKHGNKQMTRRTGSKLSMAGYGERGTLRTRNGTQSQVLSKELLAKSCSHEKESVTSKPTHVRFLYNRETL